ncbi:MAG TPA: S-adenosyl-l-methionine hydroxide adenosyltransferase family protein [Puia sp.]|nr:S-adenosyl-l-methionine hydroxide adenosyltransferase family protein [Puia sp.]
MISIRMIIGLLLVAQLGRAQNKIVVYQSDFGLKDGAVAEMKGVAMGVSPDLKLFDLTHEIPAYNIWDAAYRLQQTVPYWPAGTVFVSVVDPGVGTARKSVVLRTKTGQFIVTPDNGTLTLVAETLGIGEIREIDEAVNRRPESRNSYTFHGRDVYSYTGARLAAGVIRFDQVGPLLPKQEVVMIPYQRAVMADGVIRGAIPVLDVQYGNVWTNIPADLFRQLGVSFGEMLQVRILHGGKEVYKGEVPYEETFGSVGVGKPLVYLNSLMQVAVALNQGNFAAMHQIGSGGEWAVEIKKK